MGFLTGKTAIITGAGRAVLEDGSCGSIGYGIATAYAKEGANLVITGRNVQKLTDAKEELDRNRSKEYHSKLKNLISAMVNSEGFKYNHSQVWDMKINAFMDSVKRISKIKNSDLLLQSGYSGYGVNLKEVDKNQLDWIGELD